MRGSWDGNASSPSRKNSTICISAVAASKKCTNPDLLGIRLLPRIIPVRYTLR